MTGGLAGGSIVFFHAHPDDEAIFTGGTIALLAEQGCRLVVVLATQGEQGEPSPLVEPGIPLAVRRVAETAEAAERLGAERVEFLGYHDSGLVAGDGPPGPMQAFAGSSVEEAAQRLRRIITEEKASCLVSYDEQGIYGHPDHIQVHRVARRAAELAGVPTVYEATVDREYLHFVETHLVVEASRGRTQPDPAPGGRSGGPGRSQLGLAASALGLSTVEIDCTVDVRPVLPTKRQAMAAHASQIPETCSAMRLPDADFAAVYGFEWYLRHGPHGAIDELSG